MDFKEKISKVIEALGAFEEKDRETMKAIFDELIDEMIEEDYAEAEKRAIREEM